MLYNCLGVQIFFFFWTYILDSEVLMCCLDGNKYKGSIYMVFEYMDHDLTGLSDRPGMRFSVPQIKVLVYAHHD